MVVLTKELVLNKTRLSSLSEVRHLNLWGQQLSDVSLLSEMPNLEVASLSVNQITSLRDFGACLKLHELYLRKNEVADVQEVQHLSCLKQLKVLWLSDNPCAESIDYRQRVLAFLPSLEKLDNVDVSAADRESVDDLQNAQAASQSTLTFVPHTPPPALPPPKHNEHAAVRDVRRQGEGESTTGTQAAPGQRLGLVGSNITDAPCTAVVPATKARPNLLYAVLVLIDEMAQSGDMESLKVVRKEATARLESRQQGPS